MAWIILFTAIILSSFLTISFKYFQKYKINNSSAIVVNYITASTLAFVFAHQTPSLSIFFNYKWWWASLLTAFLFITLFNLLALTSQRIGISQTNIANKTTFIFPTLMGIIFFNESYNLVKILGIVLAVIAVYKSSQEKAERASTKHSNFILILALFIGGGCLDLVLSYNNEFLISKEELPLFPAYSFLFAGCFGLIALVKKQFTTAKTIITKKEITGGIILGIINYFSIFTFLSALYHDSLESSVVFTAVNMGIIVTTSLLSAVLFNESLSKNKIIAVLLAVCSILFVSFSNVFQF